MSGQADDRVTYGTCVTPTPIMPLHNHDWRKQPGGQPIYCTPSCPAYDPERDYS